MVLDSCYDLILNPTLEGNELTTNFIARGHDAKMPGFDLNTKGGKVLVYEGHI